jgi:hypothetical protein
MSDPAAYSTDQPDHVAAYRTAVTHADHQRARIAADMKALGVGTNCHITGGPLSGSDHYTITALDPKDDYVPAGWRILQRDGMLHPRRGQAGDAARQWLADHTIVNVIAALYPTGLARAAWVAGTGHTFGYRVIPPTVFEQDNTLWALYAAEPGNSDAGLDRGEVCTWTRRPLSDYYLAKERHDAATKATAG